MPSLIHMLIICKTLVNITYLKQINNGTWLNNKQKKIKEKIERKKKHNCTYDSLYGFVKQASV